MYLLELVLPRSARNITPNPAELDAGAWCGGDWGGDNDNNNNPSHKSFTRTFVELAT